MAGLSQAQRGRLHGLLARALEAENAEPSEVARHFREAGDVAAAAEAYARAARSALDGHATREAAALADAGIDLRPQPPVCGDLLEVRAEARAVHGDLDGALARNPLAVVMAPLVLFAYVSWGLRLLGYDAPHPTRLNPTGAGF